MRLFLKHRKNLLLLISLVNLILTPIHLYIINSDLSRAVIAFNMLLILLAGINLSKKFRWFHLLIGFGVISFNIITVFYTEGIGFNYIRLIFTSIFYLLIFRLIVLHLIETNKIVIDGIFGAISGYLLIGLFGGVLSEFVYHTIPNSFDFNIKYLSDFHFYYYSFTGITTVGFGDIVPINPQSQSITILMNITGQLYLTTVMALFVGKFINSKNT